MRRTGHSESLRVSVLIPTWHRPTELKRCIAALDAQTRPPDEVLVIVRDADEVTWETLASIEPDSFDLRTVSVHVPGVIAALNSGLACVSGDIVAITDDDTTPWPDWLSRIERHFNTDPLLGGVGGRDWVHHHSHVEEGVRRTVGKLSWYGRLVGNHHLGAGRPREVDVLKGANMAFRHAAVENVRLDERLRGSGAQVHFEVDLSLGVKARGWRLVYDPAIAVDHHPAVRQDAEQRDSLSVAALCDEVHNETYVLLKRLAPARRPLALTYWLAVGTRRTPGLALLVERWLRESDRAALLDRFSATIRGRMAGINTFRRSGG